MTSPHILLTARNLRDDWSVMDRICYAGHDDPERTIAAIRIVKSTRPAAPLSFWQNKPLTASSRKQRNDILEEAIRKGGG